MKFGSIVCQLQCDHCFEQNHFQRAKHEDHHESQRIQRSRSIGLRKHNRAIDVTASDQSSLHTPHRRSPNGNYRELFTNNKSTTGSTSDHHRLITENDRNALADIAERVGHLPIIQVGHLRLLIYSVCLCPHLITTLFRSEFISSAQMHRQSID